MNRIILATDGDFNVGVSDREALTKLVKEKAKGGTYLSVLGFGSGNINDAMLESITNHGNGNYSYIDTIKEGRKVLLEDMMGTLVTIAKDVKVQVEMNPSKVKAYRLIGYANRMLPPEAFLDKKVDAGEIGAGHSVTALYEIIPADGKPFGPEIDASRYFEKKEEEAKVALKESDEMCFVKLAYKQAEQKVDDESTYLTVPFVDGAESDSKVDLNFAAAVALFGMQLRESEYKGNGDLKMVQALAEKGLGNDGKGLRAEFIK
ncbi:YfbK domain-containing protein [Rubritalea tangerina]|uniref:YfbK domain-containing protein n=1 Tax=Rubritalea tangerina TaxID=430798 RepID=UPI003623FD81